MLKKWGEKAEELLKFGCCADSILLFFFVFSVLRARLRGWAVIDAKQREEEKRAEAEGQDEAEDLAAEAEQKRQEDEEAAAARAVGDANYRRKPTKLSKKRQRREEQRRRALTGEEWSADALLCWSFEAKVF
jgi:biopolymer transport protein ExbB/TolQ